MRYRKKPVVVEAMQWDGDNTTAVLDFATTARADAKGIYINTLEWTHRASVGDYIIKGVRCMDCGAIVDPYEALYYFAAHYERLDRYLEGLQSEWGKLENYIPRRKTIKWLEERYNQRANVMLPTCPECGVPFRLEELQTAHWVNEKHLNLFPKRSRPADQTK